MPKVGTVQVKDVQPRQVAHIEGRVVSVRVEPADLAPAVTARVQDATGHIDAVFMGRRHVPGIEPGRLLAVEGRIAKGAGPAIIYNPRYELLCPR